LGVAALLASTVTPALAEAPAPFVYETPTEFFAGGDFRGIGRTDLVIVDKETGRYRLGYQQPSGELSWVECRPSGLSGLTGFSAGKLLAPDRDALAFTSPDASQLTIVEAASVTAPGKPVVIPFSAALGPSLIVPTAPGGGASRGVADLYVGSIYNSPDANEATFLNNDGAQFPKLADEPLPGAPARGNLVALEPGQPAPTCLLVHDEKGDTLRLEGLSNGKPVLLGAANGLPAGSDYTVGGFGNPPSRQFIIYRPGSSALVVRPVEAAVPGQVRFAAGETFDLGQPVRRVVTLEDGAQAKLFVIFGDGESAGVYQFDGRQAPVLAQTIVATNQWITCAESLPGRFILFSEPAKAKVSTRYQVYTASPTGYQAGVFGSLPSLAENDNITIEDIHSRVVAGTSVKTQDEMKPYTNTIPGTHASYAMVPIPGGEFLMGSPESEPQRKPDEGPQHKVKVSPFWMGRCEVTWNEYELFMYPDEEHQMRATLASDPAADKLADAVTHPSRPYVEMSFGMGKDGYPAISMTQHGANKYCQWLSAKTGHFYRLPTEAEWEYAARAGTTNTYFFGDDASKLGEYAWFEDNSDFKYQKVGKKKPNPWGLYDIYGNVVEWVLDQYDPDYYQQCSSKGESVDPWNRAAKPYPLAVRGGSWTDGADLCRSAARRGSDRSWKMQDPQLPKSTWYFTDAQFVGFRIIRPLKVPTQEEMRRYWNSGVEKD